MNRPVFRKQLSRISFIYVLMLFVINIVQLAMMKMFTPANTGLNPFDLNFFYSTVPLYLTGFPLAVFLFSKIPDCEFRKEKIRLSLPSFFKIFLVAYAFFYVGGAASNILQSIYGAVFQKELVNPVEQIITGSDPFLLFAGSVIIAPIGEELLFRYLPYKKLGGFGDAAYIISSSLLFALFHMNFFQIIYTFTAGLVFSYVYAKTSDLKYNIMLHMFLNMIGGVLSTAVLKNSLLLKIFTVCVFLMMTSGIIIFYHYVEKITLRPCPKDLKCNLKIDFLNPGIIAFAVFLIVFSIYVF